ncbi:MAG: transcriptional repressor LexA [Actinomycetes bacterium]
MAEVLSGKRLEILHFISECQQDRGYPPSVREIGTAVGLASSATVHSHLAVLQREGYLEKDPTKPRALTVRFDPSSKAQLPMGRSRSVPLIGTVAAGTGVLAQENVEELYNLPDEFAGTGETFMLKVRGDSMIGAGILDGDYVVVRHQPDANDGEIVVAGINDDEATVKTLRRQGNTVILVPANDAMAPIEMPSDEVVIYGKVISVLRRL